MELHRSYLPVCVLFFVTTFPIIDFIYGQEQEANTTIRSNITDFKNVLNVTGIGEADPLRTIPN
jgi:hypothetical protein